MSRKNLTGRGRLTAPSHDVTADNGTVQISIVDGEQLHFEMTVNWMTNLQGATITAKIVEADNDGLGTKPSAILADGEITTLQIIDANEDDNVFVMVIPDDLVANYAVKPDVAKPVYGFIGLEIADNGEGGAQQKWKPLRGLVEILYSPSEAI